MLKRTLKYSATEMAETIHRTAIKAVIQQAYCEEMAEHYTGGSDWQIYDDWQAQASKHGKEYNLIKDLAFQTGTTITHREEEIAYMVGTIAAKNAHSKE